MKKDFSVIYFLAGVGVVSVLIYGFGKVFPKPEKTNSKSTILKE